MSEKEMEAWYEANRELLEDLRKLEEFTDAPTMTQRLLDALEKAK